MEAGAVINRDGESTIQAEEQETQAALLQALGLLGHLVAAGRDRRGGGMDRRGLLYPSVPGPGGHLRSQPNRRPGGAERDSRPQRR